MTREVLRQPPDAGAFDWRLSLATIDAPGPFSVFDGYARTLVLVHGAGVELDFGQHGRSRLTVVGQMAAFDGSWQTSCQLIDGPSTDLNLIVARHATSSSRCIPIEAEQTLQTSGWTETLVCCIRGTLQLTNGSGVTEQLAALDVARCGAGDGTISCRPIGTLAALIFVGSVRR
jgi:environmental stress-induced protein Ves